MKFYFAEFISPMYPEDNEILEPGYRTEEEAEARIRAEVMDQCKTHAPNYYQCQEWNYNVRVLEVVGE